MSTPPVTPPRDDLVSRLGDLTLRDESRLRRRLDQLRGRPDGEERRAALAAVAAEIERAAARVERRRAAVPTISYPPELPVSQKRDDIRAAIRDHQVVIVAGETGSGKTTQLPKICLELGRGVRGQIGHTQPRRLAARTVADRIAEELGIPLGEAVGYTVRFTDRASEDTLVKLMTDGILLAEIQRDRQLRRYDTLIIDEAHERSLNIDFLLGYLKQLLPRRPDLKVIITSATIDPERFSRHFDDAPIVEVSGRTYPVEVRYRPVVDPDAPEGDPAADPDRDQTQAVLDAVTELQAEGPGDILVFLSGEREIRDTADALVKSKLPHTDILPLYARLSAAEQHRVFEPHGRRRVVLATNVAETSLTVPGIKYVVDPGTARISRYSHRTKVQRLPIEPISQASANQRAGRCGRTSDGICIRLYTEADYLSRPEFTEPEILRTNLASVILQMTALGLGDLAAFPFVEPPDRRNVTAGVQLLEELGALDPKAPDPAKRLTPLGRTLAQLPVDPRLGRMVLAADRNGCLPEVMVIAAALSIQDPRERPADQQQAAAEKHARFTDPTSDFLSFLNLWNYLQAKQAELSSSGFRRLCKAEFLHYLRVREWQDLHGQLRQIARGLGLSVPGGRATRVGQPTQGGTPPRSGRRGRAAERLGAPESAADLETETEAETEAETDGDTGTDADEGWAAGAVDPRGVHVSLLAGLLSHIGLQDVPKAAGPPNRRGGGRSGPRRPIPEYLGARGSRFAIFPGSALAKKPPRWVMAAELVETSRLWARVVARIEPEWIEELAGHLVIRTYSEPRWDAERGAVLASEKVTLYGVPLVAGRPVNYGRIDPVVSRELFIRHALVEGEWRTHHRFFHDNRTLLASAEELEHRARRRGLVVDDETLFDFYDQRIGAEVVSARHFDSWWKKTRRDQPDLLTFTPSMLVSDEAAAVSATDYPDVWEVDGLRLRLSYQFEPGSAADGVTARVPLAVLNQVPAAGFAWQVPGLRHDVVTALIRSLPKELRRHFVPAPDVARAVLAGVSPDDGPLPEVLSDELRRLTGVAVPPEAWQLSRLPDHLRVAFQVVDEKGRTVRVGRDLGTLKRELEPRIRAAIAAAVGGDGDRPRRSRGRERPSGQRPDGAPAAGNTPTDGGVAPGGSAATGTTGAEAPAGDVPGAVERTGLRDWTLGDLPRLVQRRRSGYLVKGYPALVDEGQSVAVRLFDSEAEQRRAMWAGTRRLLRLTIPAPNKAVVGRLSNSAKLALSHNPHGSVSGLLDDCVAAAVDALVQRAGGPAWDADGFAALRDAVRADLVDTTLAVLGQVEKVLAAAHEVSTGLARLPSGSPAAADLRAQLSRLVHPGFVAATGAARLRDLVRYVRAMARRLETLPRDPRRDQGWQQRVEQVEAVHRDWLSRLPPERAADPAVGEIRWMIEELRVSLFAQTLGTAYPVSEQRIYRAMDAAGQGVRV